MNTVINIAAAILAALLVYALVFERSVLVIIGLVFFFAFLFAIIRWVLIELHQWLNKPDH